MKASIIKYDFKGKHITSIKVPLAAIKTSQQGQLYKESILIKHYIYSENNMAYSLVKGDKFRSYLRLYIHILDKGFFVLKCMDNGDIHSYYLDNNNRLEGNYYLMNMPDNEIPLFSIIDSFDNRLTGAAEVKYSVNLKAQIDAEAKSNDTQLLKLKNLINSPSFEDNHVIFSYKLR